MILKNLLFIFCSVWETEGPIQNTSLIKNGKKRIKTRIKEMEKTTYALRWKSNRSNSIWSLFFPFKKNNDLIFQIELFLFLFKKISSEEPMQHCIYIKPKQFCAILIREHLEVPRKWNFAALFCLEFEVSNSSTIYFPCYQTLD